MNFVRSIIFHTETLSSVGSSGMSILGILLLLLVPSASAQEPPLIFNEIAWMGTTTSANNEWIELYNTTSTELTVTGYKIIAADGSPSITLKGTVLPYGFFLLERTDDTTTPALADMLYTGALSNESETLRLYDTNGNLVDELSGWSTGDNETKQTMARDTTGWKFGMPNGTPGAANIFSEAPSEKVSPPKKQTTKSTLSRQPVTPTPLVTKELPETPPISASAIPITLKDERKNISPLMGFVVALLGVVAATSIILPRVQKSTRKNEPEAE